MCNFVSYEVKLSEDEFYIPEEFFTGLEDSNIFMLKVKEDSIVIGDEHFLKCFIEKNVFQNNNLEMQRRIQRVIFNRIIEINANDILSYLTSKSVGLRYGDKVTVKNDENCIVITLCQKA